MNFRIAKKALLTIILFSLLSTSPFGKEQRHGLSRKKFEQSLMEKTGNHRITFISKLPFDNTGKVIMSPCAHCDKISLPIRWIPVVPLALLFESHPCYKQKICINKRGERFKGLSCCEKLMPDYCNRRFDPINYIPEINLYAAKIKPTANHSHPHLPVEHRGHIARTYLAMMRKYHLKFPYDVKRQYERWDRDYPPEAWEKQ